MDDETQIPSEYKVGFNLGFEYALLMDGRGIHQYLNNQSFAESQTGLLMGLKNGSEQGVLTLQKNQEKQRRAELEKITIDRDDHSLERD